MKKKLKLKIKDKSTKRHYSRIIGFKLKIDVPEWGYLPGSEFEHFGGIVSGVGGIPFTNKKYFEPIKQQV